MSPASAAEGRIRPVGTLVLPLLQILQRVAMVESTSSSKHLCWCQVPVPQELSHEGLCVLHFIHGIDHDCAELRREIAQGRTGVDRQAQIAAYVKATAMKLTEVATGRVRFSDEWKKRFLTTFLTLMNLQESLDRSANRATVIRELRPAIAT